MKKLNIMLNHYLQDEPPLLKWLIVSSLILLALSLIWLLLDPRLIQHQPVALKPIKQLLGTTALLLTLPWINNNLKNYTQKPIPTKTYTTRICIVFIYEIIAIHGLAAWGLESHFNNSNLYFIFIRLIMFLGILYVWYVISIYFLFLIKLAKEKRTHSQSIDTWSQIFGVFIFLVGSIAAIFMFFPKYSQNFSSPILGGHSVGDLVYSKRILIGWEKNIGDLRIPHFFAVHNIQYFLFISILLKKCKIKKYFLHLIALFISGLSLWTLLQLNALRATSPFTLGTFLNQLIFILVGVHIIYPIYIALKAKPNVKI